MNNIEGTLYNREKRIHFFYKNYLLKSNLEEFLKDIESLEFEFSENQKSFIKKIIIDKKNIEDEIIKYLPKDWKWGRINILEKAILLNGSSEIIIMNNKKKIVINESIEFARKYCGLESEKLINAILDKINNKKEPIN